MGKKKRTYILNFEKNESFSLINLKKFPTYYKVIHKIIYVYYLNQLFDFINTIKK